MSAIPAPQPPLLRAPLPGMPLQPQMMLSQANLMAAQAAAAVSPSADARDARRHYFNEDNKPYYHNRVTKVTTWTQPEHFKPAAQPTGQSKSSSSGRKNPWKEYKNEEGKSYYHNSETKETTWTKPADFDESKLFLIESKVPAEGSALSSLSFPSSLSDMEKAMQATLGTLNQNDESSRLGADSADANEAKQRQAERFRELLVDKYNDGRINTSMSWDNAIRQIQHDPRYRIINKVSEKKRIFNEWKTQQQKDDRDARKLAVRKQKEDFEQFLLNHPKARPGMSFSKAERLFGNDEAWKELKDTNRKSLYQDTMELLRRKREDEQREAQQRIRRQYIELLDSLDNIDHRTTWAEAQRILADCPQFTGNAELKSMHKLDQLDAFKQHIASMEEEYITKRDQKEKLRKRADRRIRDAFHELLHEFKQKGIITSSSTWVETFPIFRQDTRFTKMLQQPGCTPLDVFKFYVDDLKTRFSKDRRRIRDILEKKPREVTIETTFSDFEMWIRADDPKNEIDGANLQLYFRSLMDKAAEKAGVLKPANKKTNASESARPTVDLFENLPFNIRSGDKWSDLSKKIMADSAFSSFDPAEIERLFGKYVDSLEKEEETVEEGEVVNEKRSKERDREKKSKKSKREKKDKKEKKKKHHRDRKSSTPSPHRSDDRRRRRSRSVDSGPEVEEIQAVALGRTEWFIYLCALDVMGSIRGQPPSGQTRNLTDVFQYLRLNSVQSRRSKFGSNVDSDDRVALLDEAEQGTAVMFKSGTSYTPSWVNILDEVNFELTKIKTRKTKLKELQQKHLIRPDFNDDGAHKEQETIKELTEDLTNVFTHCRRLIRVIEESDREPNNSLGILKENVMSALLFDLNNMLCEFRSGQSHYVKQLDARKRNVDSFLLSSDSHNPYESSFLSQEAAQTDEELTIDQIQQIIANEHMVKEREREVIKISKSILELNTLFKDLAALVVDQGTILDRIDYNVEQTSLKIKAAHRHVQQAYQSHKTRKMQCIVILAAIAMFLMLIIIMRRL
ncbi:WW domain-containing protein [Aphelenchoides fujianensis]|nr:WW domain-containing protein [Aphelenchoides fujianensis]